MLEGAFVGVEGGGEVCGAGVFVGVVAEAFAAADKEHGDGGEGGHGDGVVAGSAGEEGGLALGFLEGGLEGTGESGVAGDGGLAHEVVPGEPELAAFDQGGGEGMDALGGVVEGVKPGVAEVETEACPLGDDVGGVWVIFDGAYGGAEVGVASGKVFEEADEFRCASEGVLAEWERGGACVGGFAADDGGDAVLAGDGGYRTAGEAEGFEHRPLLDVGFEVTDDGGQLGWLEEGVRVKAPEAEGLLHGDALGVAELEPSGLEGAGEVAAAEVGGLVAQAFLIGKTDDFEGEGQGVGLGGFECGQGEEEAEGAVVFAGVAHGVEMGAHEEGGLVGC